MFPQIIKLISKHGLEQSRKSKPNFLRYSMRFADDVCHVSAVVSFNFHFSPLVEKFQDNQRLKAILSGVTAAVVGVILNLAIMFGIAVIYHEQKFDFFALFLTIISLIV